VGVVDCTSSSGDELGSYFGEEAEVGRNENSSHEGDGSGRHTMLTVQAG
jgi:hypothetical protein